MTVNFWQAKTMPYSWYPQNTTWLWCGTDQLESQNLNWKIPITYEFNEQGFRTYNFESKKNNKVNLALGCSQTMGIGLPVEMTWPFEIEKRTNIVTLNLGLGSGSSDTVARILNNVAGIFDIHSVYILWPTNSRFELYNDEDSIISILPNRGKIEHTWYLDESNSLQRFYKNRNQVLTLQELYKFNLHEIHYDSDWRVPGDLARDQQHSGHQSNLNLANMFLTNEK